MEASRKCNKCKEVKPLTYDYWFANNRRLGGFDLHCKACCIERRRIRAKKRRIEVYEHYCGGSAKCQCPGGCSEHRVEFLTFDHINGGGKLHRDSMNKDFIGWVIRNNYPKELRILCMNCNHSFGRYGYCPHEREKQ